MRSKLFLIAILLALPGQVWAEAKPRTDEVIVRRGVTAIMRDGVGLNADIYRPRADGRFPVLLKRTPYDKNEDLEFGMKAAARGYVVIIQDVRGRYTSPGEWYPFKHESNDGYDTVEWAAALPFSDGRVGMFGESYDAVTQMLTAIAHPPHLAGICPADTASNYHDGWTYQAGAFELWFSESWTSLLAQDTITRIVTDHTVARVGADVLPLINYPLFNMKLTTGPGDLTHLAAPYFLDWLAHPDYDDYWKRWSIEENYASIQVPVLHITAWYDIFQGGALKNYMNLTTKAGNASAREKQRLIVRIGGHSGGGRKIGNVDFGPAAPFGDDAATLQWYDYLFYGAKNQFAGDKPVRIFVMGANVWRDESAWPLARAKQTKYFLQSKGKAAGPASAGVLSTLADGGNGSESYVYDPMNPTPTHGGPLCCETWEVGPQDQRPVEVRPDVLTYSTPVLTEDTEVTGHVTLELYASSSAVDTDFTAKLVDVWPNGYAQNLTEGIVRARYRDSQEKATPLEPGKVYPFALDLWSTSNVFLKGHKIRLEISSSNFPRFDRNLNTGKIAATDQTSVKATNTIYYDAQHPSALILPVIGQ